MMLKTFLFEIADQVREDRLEVSSRNFQRRYPRSYVFFIQKCFQSLFFLLFLSFAAHAVLPDERLADPTLEARARVISKELRCMICQNQSIDDSDATLAKDLRLLVRERLQIGESDAQIFAYVRDRYGDIVLLKPPLNAATIGLWVGPFVILAIAGFFLFRRRDQEVIDDDDDVPAL